MQPIIDYTFSVKDPDPNPMATVSELDKKIMSFEVYSIYRDPLEPSSMASMQGQKGLITCAVHYGKSKHLDRSEEIYADELF